MLTAVPCREEGVRVARAGVLLQGGGGTVTFLRAKLLNWPAALPA